MQFTRAGNYTFEMMASGTPAVNIAPVMELRLDGVRRASISVTSLGMDRYAVTCPVTAGLHVVALAFVNDYYAPPQDRNLAVQRLTIWPETAPRILGLRLDSGRRTATLSWEGTPGRGYEIDYQPDLSTPQWVSAATTTNAGTVATWDDDGSTTGVVPTEPSLLSRFYRLKVAAP